MSAGRYIRRNRLQSQSLSMYSVKYIYSSINSFRVGSKAYLSPKGTFFLSHLFSLILGKAATRQPEDPLVFKNIALKIREKKEISFHKLSAITRTPSKELNAIVKKLEDENIIVSKLDKFGRLKYALLEEVSVKKKPEEFLENKWII